MDDGTAADHRVDQLGRESMRVHAEKLGSVGQPRSGVQVFLDIGGGDTSADHEGKREDAPGAVPDGTVRVVNEALGAAQCLTERRRILQDGTVGREQDARAQARQAARRGQPRDPASGPSSARLTQPTS